MRGLDRLIHLRRSGLKPAIVHLDMPEMGMSSGMAMEGQLVVEKNDTPELADLRAVHGLRVVTMGKTGDFERIEAWARAAARAGANDVAVAVALDGGGLDGPVWIRRGGEDLA